MSVATDPTTLPNRFAIRDVVIHPNIVLAPMEGVSEICFRRMIRRLGGTGMTCTEFIPSQGLTEHKSKRLWEHAEFDPDERPVAVQIYGRDPAVMAEAARMIQGRGATVIDINMGCPSKKVCANSGGSALMADMHLATDIVAAVRRAITIPLTVKMRSGYDPTNRNAPELAWRCQEEGAEAITIHWRTREDGFKGLRAVDKIAEAAQRLDIPVIANGDIVCVQSAHDMLTETGCAGLMVGRGAIANPWLPRQIAAWLAGRPSAEVTLDERERVLLGFFDDTVATFRKPAGALGRMKMMARRFVDALDGAEDIKRLIVRSQTCAEARAHAVEWFARLRATPPACADAGRAAESSSSARPA